MKVHIRAFITYLNEARKSWNIEKGGWNTFQISFRGFYERIHYEIRAATATSIRFRVSLPFFFCNKISRAVYVRMYVCERDS